MRSSSRRWESLMNKIFLVIKREYLERVRSKWFLISTLLGPLLMSSFVFVPVMVQRMTSPVRTIAIVDAASDPSLCASIESKLRDKSGKENYTVHQESASDPNAISALQQRLVTQ